MAGPVDRTRPGRPTPKPAGPCIPLPEGFPCRLERCTAAGKACGPGWLTESPASSSSSSCSSTSSTPRWCACPRRPTTTSSRPTRTPLVNLMEYGLVAAILFHALNGLRVIAVDFWSKGPKYQRQMLWTVVGIWVVLMAGAFYPVLQHTLRTCSGAEADMSDRDLDTAVRPRWSCTPARRLRHRITRPPVDRAAARAHRRSPTRRPAPTSRCTPGCSCASPASCWWCWCSATCSSMLMLDGGVTRSTSPSWPAAGPRRSGRSGTWLMLWLAMLHGANGMRTIINDYAEQGRHPLLAEDAAVRRHGVHRRCWARW